MTSRKLIAACAALGLVVAACGSDDDGGGGDVSGSLLIWADENRAGPVGELAQAWGDENGVAVEENLALVDDDDPLAEGFDVATVHCACSAFETVRLAKYEFHRILPQLMDEALDHMVEMLPVLINDKLTTRMLDYLLENRIRILKESAKKSGL